MIRYNSLRLSWKPRVNIMALGICQISWYQIAISVYESLASKALVSTPNCIEGWPLPWQHRVKETRRECALRHWTLVVPKSGMILRRVLTDLQYG